MMDDPGVAQLGEQRTVHSEDAGSNPASGVQDSEGPPTGGPSTCNELSALIVAPSSGVIQQHSRTPVESREISSGVALRASDRLDEPAASFRDEFGSREVAALIIDEGLGVGHVVGEPLAMLGRHEHIG